MIHSYLNGINNKVYNRGYRLLITYYPTFKTIHIINMRSHPLVVVERKTTMVSIRSSASPASSSITTLRASPVRVVDDGTTTRTSEVFGRGTPQPRGADRVLRLLQPDTPPGTISPNVLLELYIIVHDICSSSFFPFVELYILVQDICPSVSSLGKGRPTPSPRKKRRIN